MVDYLPTLWANEVHLVHLFLNTDESILQRAYALLSSKERVIADRFLVFSAKRAYILSHAVLRVLLSFYSGLLIEHIEFDKNSYGKPFMRCAEDVAVFFNISHSKDCALLSFSKNIALGVDIEQINDKIDYLSLAKRFFSDSEFKDLQSMGHFQAVQAFFYAWAAKEAVMKGIGEGLAYGLSRIEIPLMMQPQQFEITSSKNKQNWIIENMVIGDGYRAALAVSSKYSNLVQYSANFAILFS